MAHDNEPDNQDWGDDFDPWEGIEPNRWSLAVDEEGKMSLRVPRIPDWEPRSDGLLAFMGLVLLMADWEIRASFFDGMDETDWVEMVFAVLEDPEYVQPDDMRYFVERDEWAVQWSEAQITRLFRPADRDGTWDQVLLMAIGLRLGHEEFRRKLATYVAKMIRKVRQLNPEGTTTNQDLHGVLIEHLGNQELCRDLATYIGRIDVRNRLGTRSGSGAEADRSSHWCWGLGDLQLARKD